MGDLAFVGPLIAYQNIQINRSPRKFAPFGRCTLVLVARAIVIIVLVPNGNELTGVADVAKRNGEHGSRSYGGPRNAHCFLNGYILRRCEPFIDGILYRSLYE